MLENITKYAYGTLGTTQPINTPIATIASPGPGRWKVWGTGQHVASDGLKLTLGATSIIVFSGIASSTINMGPLVIDIADTSDIILKTNIATGVGFASGTIYAQRMCEHLSEHSC